MAKQAQINAVKPALESMDKTMSDIEAFLDNVDKVADKGAHAVESGLSKSADAVEHGLEKVADVVPEALDAATHVSTEGGRKLVRFFRSPKHTAITIVILAGVAGAGLGVAGYHLAMKKLKHDMQKDFDEKLEFEISEMRRYYELRAKDGKFSTPAGAAQELLPTEVQDALKSYRGEGGEPQNITVTGAPVVHVDDDPVVEVDVKALEEKMNSGAPVEIVESTTRNLFVDGNPIEEFDYASEVLKRNPDEPYVITHDEFMDNENGFEQTQLTYYNGDDVLTDDQDVPIPDIEGLVGSENLAKFGYGSRDRNVVYVRNEKNDSEYEITMSQGEFAKEVSGFDTELRHSAAPRRFRQGHDG